VLGIGNPLRGDDSFGPALIERLRQLDLPDTVCLDAGTTPENYTGPIVRESPDFVLIADAVHLGTEPGSMTVLKGAEILRSGLTTHDQSPRMFLEQLRLRIGEEVAVCMLGVQPASLELGEDMSAEVAAALREVVALFEEIRGHNT
jgi:hydrogenase 3 maturation protease